jgi:excisionase family DNA binding protein
MVRETEGAAPLGEVQMRQQEIPPVMTVQEAAEILQLHPSTVRSYIAKGALRAVKLGHRTVRISREDLCAFLAATKAAAAAAREDAEGAATGAEER